MSKWESNEKIQRLRDYCKIRSVHPKPDYESCVEFLHGQASELDLPMVVHEFAPGKPVVVITLEGSQPQLPSILLNSHMDVVPVYEEVTPMSANMSASGLPLAYFKRAVVRAVGVFLAALYKLFEFWTYPPFDAHITEEGMIYARGIQDMKSVGMLHLEAVRRMKLSKTRLLRTVHVSFVPDEEIGSQEGMKLFSESEEFKKLNIGFELDESAPHQSPDKFYAFNGERTSRQITITCKGSPTHGALLESGTAGEKIHYIINKFMEFRASEKKKLDAGVPLGDVTTINLTQLEGGVQVNVMPESLSVAFDIRVAPDMDAEKFEEMIEKWCSEAGENVSYVYLVKNPVCKSTDRSVPEWRAITRLLRDMGIGVDCETCPGATDARFVRLRGIPAFNLTPVRATEMRIHGHDENMAADNYLRGIDVMYRILETVANVCPCQAN